MPAFLPQPASRALTSNPIVDVLSAPRNTVPKSHGARLADDSLLQKFPREPQVSISDENPSSDPASRKHGQIDLGPDMKGRGAEPTYISSHPHKDFRLRGVKETGSVPDSPPRRL